MQSNFSYPVNSGQGVKSIQVLGDFNNWDNKSCSQDEKGKEDFTTGIELNAGSHTSSNIYLME
ncbi:MAG: hypothetical protein IPP49_06320 [Saprospiraceae bacterium]|nr:hypothetical protein [Saprospiraceae bacterium]